MSSARGAAGPSRNFLLFSVLLGLLSTNITFTIFNVALVDIAKGLHTTSSTLTWAITGPLLMVGVSAPLIGRVGDLRGHRRTYLAGLCGALVCAALTASAPDAGILIAARLLSGVSGACLTASSWALLFRRFGPAERTRVLGWWSLVGAGGPVIGVAAGGPVIEMFGWRWIFVAQVPLIAAALVANWKVIPDTEVAEGADSSIDLGGAVLLALGVGAVLMFVNRLDQGWSNPLVAGSIVVAAVALPAFALFERRASSPVFPLEWLSDRRFLLPCGAAFALNFAYMGGFFLTPLFLEQGLHYSVGQAGFFQIARPLVFAVAAPAAGYLAVRTGERAAAIAGALVLVASMLAFAWLSPGGSALLIVVALGASGLANGIATPSISAMVAGAADIERMGSASAGMQVASQLGVVTGIQVMESVQVARQHLDGVVGSYHSSYLAGAAVAVLSVVAAAMIRPSGRRERIVLGRLGGPGAAAVLSATAPAQPEAALEAG